MTTLPPRPAFALFAVVILAWGVNWPVTKMLVATVPPLWITACRSWIAFAAIVAILAASRRLAPPPREDAPVILGVALLHMVAFSTLTAAGLAVLPAGKAIVLGYTTPFFVALAAPRLLGERLTRGGMAGVALGIAGLLVLLSPATLDLRDGRVLLGCAAVLAAAMAWAGSIIVGRRHRWTTTPLQLLPWQTALAGTVITAVALAWHGLPDFPLTARTAGLLAFSGLVGTALAYWAMSMVMRSLPALTTALGVTATPLVGIAVATLGLGEALDPSLAVAAGLVVTGIAVGTLSAGR